MTTFTKIQKKVITVMAVLLFTVSFAYSQPFWQYEILRVNVNSGATEQLTNVPGIGFFNPSFSNNGMMMVCDAVLGGGGQVLVVTDLSTGQINLLGGYPIDGNDPSWSPNGNLIVFDYWDGSQYGLWTIPAGGEDITLVREGGGDAEWSPNSQQVVFTDWYGGGTLKTVNIYTGTETYLADFGINGSWSPNGNYIVYSDNVNLFKIKVNNAGEPQGAPVQLTFNDGQFFYGQPSWSNNSQTIVFHSNLGGNGADIWTMPADGGAPTLLTGQPGLGEYDPVYSKNGKWVAYAGVPPNNAMASGPVQDVADLLSLKTKAAPMAQSYPNPFREETAIRFELPRAGYVSLQIFDAKGALVRTLAAELFDAGTYQLRWDGTSENGRVMPTGMYTFILRTDSSAQTGRMIRIE